MSKMLEDLAERFALPVPGAPKVTLSGNKCVLIEGRKELLEYTGTCVEAACGALRIRVRGEGLTLRAMNGELLIVSGTICGVDIEQ